MHGTENQEFWLPILSLNLCAVWEATSVGTIPSAVGQG